jgi:profilin
MSWDSYTQTLTSGGAAKSAAIIGLEGGVWAASPGLTISADEIKTLVSGFSNASVFQQGGVVVGGQKYMYLQSDETQIQGKKGATGVSVAKAGKCLIIGIYGDGQQPGNCRSNVERIRDYLVGVGY